MTFSNMRSLTTHDSPDSHLRCPLLSMALPIRSVVTLTVKSPIHGRLFRFGVQCVAGICPRIAAGLMMLVVSGGDGPRCFGQEATNRPAATKQSATVTAANSSTTLKPIANLVSEYAADQSTLRRRFRMPLDSAAFEFRQLHYLGGSLDSMR